MRKYYCDYCDKYIQETRKLHNQTELHKKNKESYYACFPNEIQLGCYDWEYILSDEQKAYNQYLEKKVLANIYTKLNHGKS